MECCEMTKPFSQELFDHNDKKGCEAVKAFVRNEWNAEAHDFFEYDIDLIVKRDNRWVGFIEVEVRHWLTSECPHKTIHIAARKKKLLENEMPTVMFVVSSSYEHGYYCTAEDVLGSPLVEVKNKYVEGGEYFYDVPIEKFVLVNL